MHCCGQSGMYSPYFGYLAAQLCAGEPGGPTHPFGQPIDPDKEQVHHGAREAKQFRFTFQLSYWDFFKEIANAQPRRLKNMALLLAHLVRKGRSTQSLDNEIETATH